MLLIKKNRHEIWHWHYLCWWLSQSLRIFIHDAICAASSQCNEACSGIQWSLGQTNMAISCQMCGHERGLTTCRHDTEEKFCSQRQLHIFQAFHSPLVVTKRNRKWNQTEKQWKSYAGIRKIMNCIHNVYFRACVIESKLQVFHFYQKINLEMTIFQWLSTYLPYIYVIQIYTCICFIQVHTVYVYYFEFFFPFSIPLSVPLFSKTLMMVCVGQDQTPQLPTTPLPLWFK